MQQVTKQRHTIVIMPEGGDIFATWPRNKYGHAICTKTRPMPLKYPKGLYWEHDDVHETDADSDYCIEHKCNSCGHIWRTEMPD